MITGEKSLLYMCCITSFYLPYRRNIESAHGREVERLRKEYSQEDKEMIEKCLEVKRVFKWKPAESLAQEPEEKPQLLGKLGTIKLILILSFSIIFSL